MNQASVLRDKAEMFERRAETATDPISKQHYREMAAESHCVCVSPAIRTKRMGPNERLSDQITDQPGVRHVADVCRLVALRAERAHQKHGR
jgi:hypothetical protein